MDYYINETEYATRSLLDAIWFEFDLYEKLNAEVSKHFSITINEFQSWENQKTQPTESMPYSLAQNLNKMVTQGNDIEELKNNLRVKNFSRSTLSGSLLNIAKQGISYVHNNKSDLWPDGRFISDISTKDIIIQGRNQSLHWEEKNNKPKIKHFFRQLINLYGISMFGMFQHQNLAFNIIRILEWRTFENYKSDMLLFR